MHRAGLSIILQIYPSNLEAYHIQTKNMIAVIGFMLKCCKETSKSTEEYNSYLCIVLTHEYLHSFDITEECTADEL
jgi:hypothetical protein